MVHTELNTETPQPEFKLNPQTQLYGYVPPLKGLDLRGAKYMRIFKECSAQLSERFESYKQQNNGLITRREIILLSQEMGLPLKTCCEFLEYWEKLTTGTWELKFQGLSIKQLKDKYGIISAD